MKLTNPIGRATEEWIGKTADSRPPKHVRVRIFDRYGGRDYLTGEILRPGEWDLDHIKRLKDGGKNIESNLAPVARDRHRKKTAQENREGGKTARLRAAHIGANDPPRHPIPSRPFGKKEKQRKDSPFAHLPPPRLMRQTGGNND